MGNIGFWEIVALAVLALMVFGPDRLPKVARNAGRMIASFRREANATLSQLKDSADIGDLEDLKGVTAEMKGLREDLRTAGRDALTGVRTASTPGINPAPFDNDAT